MSVSVLDVALARGVQKGPDGSINGAEFMRVGLPILGGCCVCGASIAAYNAAPSRYGYLMCLNGCVDDTTGFASVADFEAWTAIDGSEE